jgi:hypothetical protein
LPRLKQDSYKSPVPAEKLTRARVIEALNLLGTLASEENLTLELCIYGGSAMMLAYGARDATKDVDVIAKPSEDAHRLALRVAERLGLQPDWLNDDVRRYTSIDGTFAPMQIQELETTAKQRLKITRPSASYLLAMKCLAGRSPLPGFAGDLDDIKFLVKKMGIRTLEEVESHLAKFYPDEVLSPKLRETVEGILRTTS